MSNFMSITLASIRAKRDALLAKGHKYLCTFEDFNEGASGHPVDAAIYPSYVHAIGGLDTSWHLRCVHRMGLNGTETPKVHGLVLGSVKSSIREGDTRDKRGYQIHWPNARSMILAGGGSSYQAVYSQYHAFDRGIGICVIYGKVMLDLTVDVYTVEESYYAAPHA